MKVIVYTKDHCPNCVSAKNLLKSKNLEFEEKSVQEAEVMKEMLGKYPDVKQMPLIVINDQKVGGLAGLQAALKQLGL